MRLYYRQQGKCAQCGRFCHPFSSQPGSIKRDNDFTIDHIIPKSKGGSSEMVNLQGLCLTCNLIKDDKIFIVLPPQERIILCNPPLLVNLLQPETL